MATFACVDVRLRYSGMGTPGASEVGSMSKRFEEALHDVGKVYDRPSALCDDAALSREQKIRLLKQWEYDLRELQVAAEENMTGPSLGTNADLLSEVRVCLGKLGADDDLELAGASKHGA
jgi:hypothetical protein